MSENFVPPFFKDLGKKLKDHLEKSYKDVDKYSVELSTKNKDGIQIKSGAETCSDSNKAAAFIEFSGAYKDFFKGKLEANAPSGDFSGEVETSKLAKGLKAKASTKSLQKQQATLALKYAFPDFMATSLTLDRSKKISSAALGLSIGIPGLVTGFMLKAQDAGQLQNFSLGEFHNKVQWDMSNLSIVLQSKWTKDQKKNTFGESVELGFLHNVNPSLVFGARWLKGADDTTKMELAFNQNVDGSTNLETKIDCCGNLSAVLKKDLSSFTLTAKGEMPIDFGKTLNLSKFGVQIDFGEQ